MQHDFVGYLLGLLDEEEKRAVDELLKCDSKACDRADLLKRCVTLLAVTPRHVDPPSGLAIRVCEYVRRKRGQYKQPENRAEAAPSASTANPSGQA